MDDINRLVSELCVLIERMPGVTVQSSHVTSALLAITLSVTTIESVGPLAYASSGANIRINLWTTAQGIHREDQENAGGNMGEHHGVDEADAPGDPGGDRKGKGAERTRPEEKQSRRRQ